jgi:2',3'-cyclic-nucleotide 2'-phosphodiesterase
MLDNRDGRKGTMKEDRILRVALIGDVVGTPGRAMFQKYVPKLKAEKEIDIIIVNGENSSNGRGITSRIARFFIHNGASVITSGNHIWHNAEIYHYLSTTTQLLRPENFPSATPGTGTTIFSHKHLQIGVLNLQGRVFMREHVDCPFRTADSALTYLQSKTPIILVDFHAETTSEKMAMGFYLDGRVSAVVGTHTHVQTADQRILPQGTAYITDLGMVGALNSMIGMQKESVIKNYLTQMPQKFVVDVNPPYVLSGVYVDIDSSTGAAVAIEPLRIIDHGADLKPEAESH